MMETRYRPLAWCTAVKTINADVARRDPDTLSGMFGGGGSGVKAKYVQ